MEDYHFRWILDGIALGTALSAIMGFLPPIAAGLSIIWLTIQIYDRIVHGPQKR